MNTVFSRVILRISLAVSLGFPLCSWSAESPSLNVLARAGGEIEVHWPAASGNFLLQETRHLSLPWSWEPVTAPPSLHGATWVVRLPSTDEALFLRLQASSTILRATSPAQGETGVAVRRETILYFSGPLAPETVLDPDTLYATFGGRRILARADLAPDRRKATLFYLEPLPGSARVVVTLQGDTLLDAAGIPLDADGDGVAGGVGTIAFDTLNLTSLPGTAVMGRVLASEPIPGALGTASNQPLAGVTITVDGREESLRTITDADGRFVLSPVPPGRFFVHIDGRTVSNPAAGIQYPDQSYYPFVGKAWEAVAGQTNNLAGGSGDIYLPLIRANTLQTVSETLDTIIGFPPSVTSENPALLGTSITVPANALFNDDGSRGGKVGLAAVPPDRLPEPLPSGLQLALVVTIQTDGASNFDQPVPVRFPNLPNPRTGQPLPPGAKSALISFNHDTGRWEIQGPMTVTPDGLFVETDPGVGVLQPGWHGTDPQSAAAGGDIGDPPCEPGPFPGGADVQNCEILSHTLTLRAQYCESYRVACKKGCEYCIDQGDIAGTQACVAFCAASTARCNVRRGECPWPPGEEEEESGDESSHALFGLQSLDPTAPLEPLQISERQQGLHYYAIENLATLTMEHRGTAGSDGVALTEELILAPQTPYRLWILEARTLRVGSADFVSASAGLRMTLPTTYTWPDFSTDADADGLGEEAERILGANPEMPDTDNDGISDSTEVRQGLNPTDGLTIQRGIIHTSKTPGPAVDVWAGNDWIVTAEGAAGLSIFQAFDGQSMTMLAHLPTPGNAQRVSGDGTSLGVAAGAAGLLIVDITDPAAPWIRHQVALGTAHAVAVSGGFAYAGFSSGLLAAVDLSTGIVRHYLTLPKAVWDLAIEGDSLFALTDDRLHAVSLVDGGFALAGAVAAPVVVAPNRRLFVGGGIAYSVHPRGYNAFRVTDPAVPTLLSAGNTAQFGWKHLVANGSGLGVAAVGLNLGENEPRQVSLYDLSHPRSNAVFITTIPTPGIARAIAIHYGLAYVADDTAGVQVVNYLPYDVQNVAPGITLVPGFPTTGAEELKLTRLTAHVTDDVQVRQVDFYLDGVRSFTDGAFPFEFRFMAPRRSHPTQTFRLRARAIDTGGNATWSEELIAPVVEDATAPRVLDAHPVSGARTVTAIHAYLSEAIASSSLTPSSVRLLAAGLDQTFGTTDDILVQGGTPSFDEDTHAITLAFTSPLPQGLYRGWLTTDITDHAGNALASDFTWQFRVADAVFWISRASGSWNDPIRWSTGQVPGTNDHVIVDLASDEIQITQGTGTLRFLSLLMNERLNLNAGAVLQVAQNVDIGNAMVLNGGVIRGGTVIQRDAGRLIVAANQANTLDAVSVVGDLDLTANSARLLIRNGLTLTGTIRLNNGGAIGFTGVQTLNSGSVVFEGNQGYLSVEGNSTLTLGPDMIVRGRVGTLGQPVFTGGNNRLINQGLISADVAGGTLTIRPTVFENTGILEEKNGGRIVRP